MCGRRPGQNFLTDDIGCAQMVPEGAVECLIKDRDALLTFYDLPVEPPAISDGAGLDALGSCSWCPASSGLAGVRASLLKARSALSCCGILTTTRFFDPGKNRNRPAAEFFASKKFFPKAGCASLQASAKSTPITGSN
jgi:hypothetical protein